MGLFESQSNLTSYDTTNNNMGNIAYADATTSYASRYPGVKGDPVGILVGSGTNIPLQMSVSTGVELTSTPTPYVAYMTSKTTISGTGMTLWTVAAVSASMVGKNSYNKIYVGNVGNGTFINSKLKRNSQHYYA